MTPPFEVMALTERLMRIDSTSGREGAVMAEVDALLRDAGWRTTLIPVSEGRANVFAMHGETPPRVVLSTHLDTVPPFIPPTRDGDQLLGRGACDAKGIAAAMICAAEQLRADGAPVGLLFVVGEEVSHDGAHAANEWILGAGFRVEALVDGEPTEGRLAVGTKGAARVIVRTEGQAAHSAYPHLGRSATSALVRLLADLDALALPHDDLLGETTINIGSLAGGVADNVVAPWAEARLMVRLVGPADEVRARLDGWAARRATLEWGVTVPAVRLGVVEGFETCVAAFATDIPALGNWGVPYLLGPGSIHVAHRPDEVVSGEELRRASADYARLVGALLKG